MDKILKTVFDPKMIHSNYNSLRLAPYIPHTIAQLPGGLICKNVDFWFTNLPYSHKQHTLLKQKVHKIVGFNNIND